MLDEPVIKPKAPMRDALIIYALLSRLGKKCTKNEVLEAVSASAAEHQLGWATDAISGFGFSKDFRHEHACYVASRVKPVVCVLAG